MAIDIWHKDAEDFIKVKSDFKRINNANLSLEIDDEFMQIVEKDFQNNTETIIHRAVKYGKDTFEYNVCPIKLYKLICKNAYKSAEPCILYTNQLFNYNLMQYVADYQILSTNACVTGDTKILTSFGWCPIEALIDKEVNIWNGYTWSTVTPKITGHNLPIYTVTFSNGTVIKCTDYHKFILQDNKRKELKDLVVGDKICKNNYPLIEGELLQENSNAEKLFYSLGFFAGDGTFKRENEPIIYLYGDKLNIAKSNFVKGKWRTDYADEHRKALTIQEYRELFSKDFVPDCYYNYKYRLVWLAGLIDSDGTRNSKDGAVSISSINKDFLYNVRDMLQTIGATGTIGKLRNATKKVMLSNNPNKENKEYYCKECYRLTISAFYVNKLVNLGLHTYRVNISCTPNRDASKFITVKSIVKTGVAETVYCLNEPKNHSFLANGILVGNCSEEPLIPHGLCVLSSFNLSEYILHPYTESAVFDVDSFKEDIRAVVVAMDDIVEENISKCPLLEQQDVARKWRNFGIGIMGLGSAFFKLGIEYGSKQSTQYAQSIMNILFREALYADVHLGKSRGNFDGYSEKIWDADIIKNNFTKDEITLLRRENHLRNCSLLSVAPTGSIGTMFAVTTGTEPAFALEYNRTTKSLNSDKDVTYKCKIKELAEYQELHKTDEIPSYFVTAQNIKWKERIDMQAALQTANDTAISSTCNLTKDSTISDVEQLFIYAWKQKIKGLSIYVEGSRDPILSTKETKETVDIVPNNAPKRPKSLTADFYQIKVNGQSFIILVGLLGDKPYEVFAFKSNNPKVPNHKGIITKIAKMRYKFESPLLTISDLGDMHSIEESASTICTSALLRHGVEINQTVNIIKKINPTITSFTSAICRILNKYSKEEITEEKCPNCGASIIREGGCCHCSNCEWSRCE